MMNLNQNQTQMRTKMSIVGKLVDLHQTRKVDDLTRGEFLTCMVFSAAFIVSACSVGDSTEDFMPLKNV